MINIHVDGLHLRETTNDIPWPTPTNELGAEIEKLLENIPDPVNNPSHYNTGKIEAIDAIEASMSKEEFRGYLKGNAQKYLWRAFYKGKPAEDLKKCVWYTNKLIEVLENDQE